MRNIKEMAEEYTSDITNPVTNNAAFLAYNRGANYVLNEIEKVVQGDLNSHSTFKLKCIKQIVEELKK